MGEGAAVRPSIVWLRDDLRLGDNPALVAAVERAAPLVVLYLLDEVSAGVRPLGGASRWWLHDSLEALRADLASLGAPLVLRRGAASIEVPRVVAETGAAAVFWNRRYGGPQRTVDAEVQALLGSQGVEVHTYQANLLHEPWTLTTSSGTPFRVFTPFWRAALAKGEPRHPLPQPLGFDAFAGLASDELHEWGLQPRHPDWAGGIRAAWRPGENGAHERLEHLVAGGLEDYEDGRDRPALDATSRLSPHLRFGEISPFQVWDRLRYEQLSPEGANDREKFLSELGWREFNWNILFYFPQLHERNFRAEFDNFPWRAPDAAELEAWRHGRTGVPLVDAGMRELWRTGYLHNRVRMVVASFLVKNLLVDWRVGEAWFWDCLVDADEANNPANWQWVAGSGADAAPYFRVFNPLLQASTFDARGEYQRRFVPELGTAAYPKPIVDLTQSRRDALTAYEFMRRTDVSSADRR